MRFLCSLVCFLLAIAGAGSAVLERKNAAVQKEWQATARAPKQHALNLHIAMSSDNRALMEQHALDISDPTSPRWRQHLSASEVSEMVEPSKEAMEAVMAWLQSVGIEGRQSHDMIIAEVAVEQAEKLLDTSYSVYEHSNGKRSIRTEHYSVPEHLKKHIDIISPTVHFPEVGYGSRPSKRALGKRLAPAPEPPKPDPLLKVPLQQAYGSPLIGPCGNGSYPHNTTTPECIRAAYSVDWTVKNPNTSFAVFDVDPSTFNDTSLQSYLQIYNKPAAKAQATFEQITYPGFNASEGPKISVEDNLDTQLSLGLAYPAKAFLYNADTDGIFGNISNFVSAEKQARGQDLFLQFLHDLTYNETVPPVVSFSAGSNEDFVPVKYASRACSMFAAAGARGVTFVFSSGDSGPVAQVRIQHNHTIVPQWPGGCPWVLTVGATANPFNETAATYNTARFTSGGGFSNLFGRPSYQEDVVSTYIKDHVDASFQKLDGFNASGRGYPDVAAFGDDVPIFSGSGISAEGGTSASTPLWAALITLLNDYEASRGKPTLGFINPWLYSLKNGELRDITIGNGSDFAVSHFLWIEPYPKVGYNGTVGWDALTGLGVPVFNKLRAALP